MGLLNESFSADIQREFPPRVAPRAMAYITKFAPTMSRIMINKPMAAWSDSNFDLQLIVGATRYLPAELINSS